MNYLEEIAHQIKAEVPGEALPENDATDLFLLYAALLLAKGPTIAHEDIHNAWVAWISIHDDGEHESAVPFGELSAEKQAEDTPFVLAVQAVARKRQIPPPSP